MLALLRTVVDLVARPRRTRRMAMSSSLAPSSYRSTRRPPLYRLQEEIANRVNSLSLQKEILNRVKFLSFLFVLKNVEGIFVLFCLFVTIYFLSV